MFKGGVENAFPVESESELYLQSEYATPSHKPYIKENSKFRKAGKKSTKTIISSIIRIFGWGLITILFIWLLFSPVIATNIFPMKSATLKKCLKAYIGLILAGILFFISQNGASPLEASVFLLAIGAINYFLSLQVNNRSLKKWSKEEWAEDETGALGEQSLPMNLSSDRSFIRAGQDGKQKRWQPLTARTIAALLMIGGTLVILNQSVGETTEKQTQEMLKDAAVEAADAVPMDTLMKGTSPALLEEKQESAPPPRLSHRFPGNDRLKVRLSEGTAPYTLRLLRRGKEVYRKKQLPAGSHYIILTEYRYDAGTYELRVEDAYGQSASKKIRIDPPK